MRRRHTVWAGLLICLLLPYTVHAGLYDPDEPESGPFATAATVGGFQMYLSQLRSIALDKVEADNPLRRRYVLLDALVRRGTPPGLSLTQDLSLSAMYLRRLQPEPALELLTALERQHPRNLLVLSNLSMAYYRKGELERAVAKGRQLLSPDVWPEQYTDLPDEERQYLEKIGWAHHHYDRLRRIEGYYVKLLRSRQREAIRKVASTDVDPIFDDGANPPNPVRFTDVDGKWTPGRIAPLEKARLPRDAADIVQQLLVWMPDDNRLYWLLGEIYNAGGTPDDVQAAFKIFEELVDPLNRQYHPQELVQRHRLLRDALPSFLQARDADIDTRIRDIGDKKDESPPLTWQSLAIAFGAGFVVALFGIWQVREWRRRRRQVRREPEALHEAPGTPTDR